MPTDSTPTIRWTVVRFSCEWTSLTIALTPACCAALSAVASAKVDVRTLMWATIRPGGVRSPEPGLKNDEISARAARAWRELIENQAFGGGGRAVARWAASSRQRAVRGGRRAVSEV